MYALAIGSVSQIIATVVNRHSQSRRIERSAELFISTHKLPHDLAVQVMTGLLSRRGGPGPGYVSQEARAARRTLGRGTPRLMGAGISRMVSSSAWGSS